MASIIEHLWDIGRQIAGLEGHVTEVDEMTALRGLAAAADNLQKTFEFTKDIREPMQDSRLCTELLNYALTHNVTVEQAIAYTYQQAVNLINDEDYRFDITFFNNAKKYVITELVKRDDDLTLANFKDEARSWLNANFPDWEMDRGRDGDKPFITLWLQGKP